MCVRERTGGGLSTKAHAVLSGFPGRGLLREALGNSREQGEVGRGWLNYPVGSQFTSLWLLLDVTALKWRCLCCCDREDTVLGLSLANFSAAGYAPGGNGWSSYVTSTGEVCPPALFVCSCFYVHGFLLSKSRSTSQVFWRQHFPSPNKFGSRM